MSQSELSVFTLQPKTLEEAMSLAKLISESDMVPQDYKGKPGNVLIAVQMGAEVGLKPMQALQNIAVINGRPSIWGDAMLAVVQNSGTVEDFREEFNEQTMAATCTAKRKGIPSAIQRTFSQQDAALAKLWGKAGPWTNSPKRMLQLRARGFVLRDGWADILKGLSVAEEQQDIVTMKSELPAAPAPIPPPKRLSEQPKPEPVAVMVAKTTENVADNMDEPFDPTPQEAVPLPSFALPTDLRNMEAKFAGKCGRCGVAVAKGANVKFSPSTRKVYHVGCSL